MHRVLVFIYDVSKGITLGTKSVKLIWKGCDIKLSTCRPCGRIKTSSWWENERVQNPRVLMCRNDSVCLFNGVPVDVNYSLIFSLSLRLLDLVVLQFATRDGGAIKRGPRHLPNLSKLKLFVNGVCSSPFCGVWVTLDRFKNVENGKTRSTFPLLFPFLCT